MPSNAMKISQLIRKLEEFRAVHGDLDVVLPVHELSAVVAVDGRNVTVATKVPWMTLPRPCVVIGLWVDERGALQQAPGAEYQVTPEEDGWIYDRSAAPRDVMLRLHRRYAGDCEGMRKGEDVWMVKDHAGRMIECVPDAILGWRRFDAANPS
jgi:hypothetical protein